MSTDKSNKKEPDNGLYTLLTAGQLVELDKDFANSSTVEVVTQTPMRLYTRVKAPNGYEWDVMTYRLTPCPNDSAMSSSGLKTMNFQNMINDNKQQKLSDSNEPAIAYTPCYKPFFERGDFYNENCNETIAKMNDNSVDLVFTSPPYYNAREYSQYKDVADYMAQMEQVFLGIERILKPSRMCVINISPVLVEREKRSEQSYRIPLPFYFVPMMEKIGFEFLEDIIWKKPDGAAANRNGGFYRHRKPVAYKPNIVTEYVLVFKKKANFLIDKVLQNNSLVGDGYERTNVWEIQPETKSWHSAPFPKKLAENVIKYYSYENETVFDCFAGSGTTGKVAETLNRKWIMSEVNTKIYNEAVERWQNGL